MLIYIIGLSAYILAVPYADFSVLRTMGRWGVVLFVLCAYTWYKSGNELVSPYFFFFIVLFVFSYGQSLLYAFDLISEKRDLIGQRGVTISQIYEAQKATLNMLTSFYLGAFVMANFKFKRYENIAVYNSEYDELTYQNGISALKRIGLYLFAISFIPYMVELIQNMVLSIKYGYGSLYGGNVKIGFANTLSFISAYFIPSIICLFIGYQENDKIRKMIYGLCGIIIMIILLTGGRSRGVILASLLVILQHIIIKRISKKQFLLLGIVALFSLTLLSTIANLRTTSNRSIEEYIKSESNNSNGMVDAVAEMGWSMFPLIKTQTFVPEYEGYRYGKTYFYAFTTIIPNIGFWEIHPAKKESNLGEWLTKKLNYTFGTGFSMCAEAYINWGKFAPFMMLLLGMLFQYLLREVDNRNLPLLIFSLIMFWFCLTIPRNSFINTVRSFAYYALPIYYYVKVKSQANSNIPFKL